MSNSVYNINKGINKPVEFRGLYDIRFAGIGIDAAELCMEMACIFGYPFEYVVH